MGTMTKEKHLIEDPRNENNRTRPRPTLGDGESSSTLSRIESLHDNLRMEEIHAEFLDNYHREAYHQSVQDENDNAEEQQLSTPKSEENLEDSLLIETPNAVAEELKASLGDGPDLCSDQKPKSRRRSESIDRRISETKRFFQAVGETPPTSQSDIQIQTIIEDDHNSDSDSDEGGEAFVHVYETGDSENFDVSLDFRLSERSDCASFQVPLEQAPQQKKPVAASPIVARTKRFLSIFHRLPSGTELDKEIFQYKGIQNPPEITRRGLSRGNYALLHRKAWLEVSDERHRYGKNLRLYYRKWESLGHPSNDFFDWLDSKGDSLGNPLPELAECPRGELDSDTVLYIKDSEVTKQYSLSLVCDKDGKARVIDSNEDPVRTGPDGWIFVLRDNVLYGSEKVTSVAEHSRQRFHHSSFFGGKAVAAAGIFLTDDKGFLTRVLPHSGHYRPGEADMQRMLFFLHNEGADLRLIEVDTQQLNHINRKDPKTFKKKAKKDSLHLHSAAMVAHFLSHKARYIGQGIFSQIHKIKNLNHSSVKDALREIDVFEHDLRVID